MTKTPSVVTVTNIKDTRAAANTAVIKAPTSSSGEDQTTRLAANTSCSNGA